MNEFAGFDFRDGGLNQTCCSEDAAVIVCRKFKKRDLSASEVLLVTNVLIGRDEQIGFSFGANYSGLI